MIRDVPPVPTASVFTVLAFAAGVICGVIVARAVQPVRVVRFFSVPPDSLCEVPGSGAAVDVRGPLQ
jgi:hypothetical protein